jgi:cytochrome P450
MYRELLNPFFSPQVVKEHEAWIRAHVRTAVESLPVDEDFDFVERFAVPVPQYVAMRAIGIPEQDIPAVRGWAHSIILNSGRDDNPAGPALFEYLTRFLDETERNPRNDVITEIVHGNVGGRQTTQEERMAMLNILLFGGLHTTTVAVAGMMMWLTQNPEGLRKLRADGVSLRNVDEFLRFITPVSYLARTNHNPGEVSVEGCPIHRGEKVLLCASSANRDASKFENPDDVMLDRDPNHHLAFGAGPHRCVGSHLARAELKIVLEELVARFSRMELVDESLVRYVGGEGRGIVHLPVRLSA